MSNNTIEVNNIYHGDRLELMQHIPDKSIDMILCDPSFKTYTNENEIALDNCLGSGTTAIACELNNRKRIGFETEPKYIEIINKRLEQIQKH